MNLRSSPLSEDFPGLYIHVPFCDGKCLYCGFYSEPLAGRDPQPLVRALRTELGRYESVPSVRTAYLGGGSPTCLPHDLLEALVETVISHWSDPIEFTVECNPAQIDERTLSMLRQHGVNRLSFGVQSFHSKELALLGRRHSVEQAAASIRMAQEAGFENVGLDLIFAIPGSTVDSWRHSLEAAIRLGVKHVSAYSLSFEPDTPFERARTAGRLQSVNEEIDRAMYELAIDVLASAGFAQYEISNFAQPGYACRHNQGYWQNRPYIGIGPSAGSYWQGRRTTNVADIGGYVERMETGSDACEQSEHPGPEEQVCETAVLNLRTRSGIDLAAFHATTGADFEKTFAIPLRRHQNQGLMEVRAGCARLTRPALAIADAILCDFSSL